MIRALAGALALALAALVLALVLWRRDIAELERQRAQSGVARQTLEAVRGQLKRSLGMVDAERAEVAACRRDAADAAAEAREVERQACGRLVSAARAQGRLDVDPADLSAVVSALRGRK